MYHDSSKTQSASVSELPTSQTSKADKGEALQEVGECRRWVVPCVDARPVGGTRSHTVRHWICRRKDRSQNKEEGERKRNIIQYCIYNTSYIYNTFEEGGVRN